MQGKKRKLQKQAASNPRLRPSPLIYQDSIFSCTWNSNGFLGINNDSCEANIRDFRVSINAGGIQRLNSPIIHHISPTAQTQTLQPYQKGLLKAQVCLLSFTLQTVRTSNGWQLIAWTFSLHGRADNGKMSLDSSYQNNDSKITQLNYSFIPGGIWSCRSLGSSLIFSTTMISATISIQWRWREVWFLKPNYSLTKKAFYL